MGKGEQARRRVAAALLILRADPLSAGEWGFIARLLRTAADEARAVAKVAGVMERPIEHAEARADFQAWQVGPRAR